MRIFTAVRHSFDPRFYYGDLWAANFHPALGALGHDVVESRVDLLPASRFMHVAGNFTPQEQEVRARITQQIVEQVRAAHSRKPLDLFLSYFYNAHFDPSGFETIHRLGIPTVNFYCNSIYQFELVSDVAVKVNFAWHAEKEARALYMKAGANPVWVQLGANPRVYHPVAQARRQVKGCFVGQRYSDRDRWVSALVKAGIPVEIYGPGWGHPDSVAGTQILKQPTRYLGRKHYPPRSVAGYLQVARLNVRGHGVVSGLARTWHQFVYRRRTQSLSPLFLALARGQIPFREICSVFSAYEVILNFSNVWADGRPGSKLIPHVRLRDFEAPMCRTCYLTGYTEEITEFYDVGREIDTYRTPEELIDKTMFYLSHPSDAERLRDAGYQCALRDHTWERRFEKLFCEIGLKE